MDDPKETHARELLSAHAFCVAGDNGDARPFYEVLFDIGKRAFAMSAEEENKVRCSQRLSLNDIPLARCDAAPGHIGHHVGVLPGGNVRVTWHVPEGAQ